MSLRARAVVLFALCLPSILSAQQIRNWPAPPVINMHGPGAISANGDIGPPAVFIPVTPCRVVDTRLASGPYGGPILSGTRTYNIATGPCTGIPSFAVAYSVSLGVTGNASGGYLTAYPAGTTRPLVANMTWSAGQTLTTGAVIAAASNSISVFTSTTTHFTLDINGYYIGDGATLNSTSRLLLTGSYPGAVIQGASTNTTSGIATGVWGEVYGTQHNAVGVYGGARGTTSSGRTVGVWGETYSTAFGAMGVAGYAGAAVLNTEIYAGVFGSAQTNIEGGVGVFGQSGVWGVIGQRISATGEAQTIGVVGGLGNDGFFTVDNFSAFGTKSFVEPDPDRAGAVIKYVALEGPEAGTYFRGSARARNGRAVITVPDDFRDVSDEDGLTVQITPIGGSADYWVESFDLNTIVVRTSRDIQFFYMVNGVRRAFKDFMPRQIDPAESYFVPTSARMRIEQMSGNPEIQRRLIANGTFNADGSVNLAAAEAKGWAAAWRAREAAESRNAAAPAGERARARQQD